MIDNKNGDIIIYQTDNGLTKIDVKVQNETVWLSQQQMAELFSTSRTNIIEHINNIYLEEELDKNSTCQNFRQVQKEGNRNVSREIPFYNLDMIISLGYRIKSKIATNFRKWATERLKEYMIKGFTMDDERLKGNGGGNYWRELLARIKDIRSSEKVLYRQVLDLYATAVDYNPKDEKSIEFFKIVQNKLHYATHGHTASEVIYERADSEKPFMGLTTFKGDIPVLSDVVIAKNYLSEEELKVLNNLVSGYFDFAEIQAIRHNPMYMEDYIKQLDMILSSTGEKLLIGAGSISHNQAIKKAKSEYKKYQVKTISPVEEEYLKVLKEINNKIENQYYYDIYGQLIKENNYITNKTTTYTYDSLGNILTQKTYNMSDNSLVSQNLYEYNNLEWQDQLTKFNSDVITYDEIGNPLKIGDNIKVSTKNVEYTNKLIYETLTSDNIILIERKK